MLILKVKKNILCTHNKIEEIVFLNQYCPIKEKRPPRFRGCTRKEKVPNSTYWISVFFIWKKL